MTLKVVTHSLIVASQAHKCVATSANAVETVPGDQGTVVIHSYIHSNDLSDADPMRVSDMSARTSLRLN